MTTKDVLLVVGGVALGYWLATMNYGRKTATAVGEVVTGVKDTATGVLTDVKDVVVDTKKSIECEQKWSNEIGNVTRFVSDEAREESKRNYISKCSAS